MVRVDAEDADDEGYEGGGEPDNVHNGDIWLADDEGRCDPLAEHDPQLAIWDTTNKDLEWTQSSLVRATDISSGDTYLVSREVVRKIYNRPVVRVSNYFSIFDWK